MAKRIMLSSAALAALLGAGAAGWCGEAERIKQESGGPFGEASKEPGTENTPVLVGKGGAAEALAKAKLAAETAEQPGLRVEPVPVLVEPKPAAGKGKWYTNGYLMGQLGETVGVVSGLGIVKAVGPALIKSGSLPGALISFTGGLYIMAQDYRRDKGGDRGKLAKDLAVNAARTGFAAALGFFLPPLGVIFTLAVAGIVVGVKAAEYLAKRNGR